MGFLCLLPAPLGYCSGCSHQPRLHNSLPDWTANRHDTGDCIVATGGPEIKWFDLAQVHNLGYNLLFSSLSMCKGVKQSDKMSSK